MPNNKPLTIEEINQMPLEALAFGDFARLRSDKLKFSNYSYNQASAGFPKGERERILMKLGNENDARWYWIWIRRGLNPDRAEQKVCVDNTLEKHRIRKTEILMARNKRLLRKPVEIYFKSPRHEPRHLTSAESNP